jgi:hypothetical protein
MSLTPVRRLPTGCTTEHRAAPDDNYFSTAWSVALMRDYVPAYCSSDAAAGLAAPPRMAAASAALSWTQATIIATWPITLIVM